MSISMSSHGRILLNGVCAIALSIVGAVQTEADEASTTADSVAGDSALAEIVVTAQRRAESKQTTPVSISAFTSDTLVANGIESAADLQRLTPGVVLNGSGTVDNTTFTIRGQGKAVIGPGLPSVITYLNEVPLTGWGSSPPTFDVNNVQILKGPQGTAFGRNTTGGAVLVYTALPTYEFGGYAQVQYGNYGDTEFQGALNLPIIDQKLAIRIATDIERRNGYTENIATGHNMDDKHSNAFRLSVLAQPMDALKNVVVFDYSKYATDGVSERAFQYVDPLCVPNPKNCQFPGLAPIIAAQSPRAVDTPGNPTLHNTYFGVSNTTTADLDVLTVKNIFGFRDTRIYQSLDAVGLPLVPLPTFLGPLAGLPGVDYDSLAVRHDHQYSDELQFSGTAADKNLTWLFGAFYLKDLPSGPDYLVSDNFRPVSPFFQVPASFPSPISALGDNLYTDESHSAFLTLTYNLAQLAPVLQGLRFEGGYRYTWDTESVCANGRSVVSFLTGDLLAQPFQSLDECRANSTSYSGSATFKAPTYTAGLDYTVNDDVFLYFTNRTGYRAGGVNTPALASSLAGFQTYGPQKVKDYEIGLHDKWRIDGWQGRFNIDVFHDRYSDLQVQASGLFPGTPVGGVVITPEDAPSNSILTFNSGTATFEGIDLDGSVSPFRGLNFSYGAAYLNARYDSITVPGILQPFFTAAKFDGSPRWSYQAAVDYVLPFHLSVGGDISANVNFYHIDEQNQQSASIRGYSLTDASVKWGKFANTPLDLTLFVNNAFNALYVQSVAIGGPGLGVYSGNYGPPRMFGIRLRYTFGH
jgi:iron complex outermembrane recepter protein